VSDTNGAAREGMAKANIVSDTIDKGTLKHTSDGTSGTAGKMYDRNMETRGTIDYACQT